MLCVIDECSNAHAPQHDYRESVRATVGKPSRWHASQDRNRHDERLTAPESQGSQSGGSQAVHLSAIWFLGWSISRKQPDVFFGHGQLSHERLSVRRPTSGAAVISKAYLA